MSQRIIHRTYARPHRLIAEALQSLIVGDLLAPGQRLIIVSPWISDVPLIDNRRGSFTALNSTWGSTIIRLSAVLRTMLSNHTKVYIATGPDRSAVAFVRQLKDGARRDGTDNLLTAHNALPNPNALDHQKAIAGDDWIVHGSMNLTYRGIELNGELVTISNDLPNVAAVTTELMSLF
jgi:hypothetical protein